MAKNKSQQPKQKSQKQVSILIDQMNLGGVADSPYMGSPKSVASVVGLDLHAIPNLTIVAQALKKDSETTITDLVKILPCSDGNTYFFGQTSGTVWKRTSGGTYSNLGTVSPAAGAVGILDAYEFNGKIYYAMQNRLGQWDFTGAFSGRNDNFATFANGDAVNHPMFYMLSTLYIGDGKNLAQVDKNATFTNNALSFTIPIEITALGKQANDLLVCCSPTNNTTDSHVYRWNTWSVQTTYDYLVPETSINAIFTSDADVFLQAGLAGRFYRLNGQVFTMMKQIPSNFPTTYSNTQQSQVYYPAVTKFQGLALFGVSSVTGDPSYEGVWAVGSRGDLYPNIFTLPFPISTGNLQKVVIWSMAVSGSNLFVSWKDTNSGTVYGVDIIDYSNKFTAPFFETRVIKYSKVWLDIFKKIVVNYQSLPTNTGINIFYDANWAGYIQYNSGNGEIFTDTQRNEVYTVLNPTAKTMRFKVALVVNGNNAPSIEDMIIFIE